MDLYLIDLTLALLRHINRILRILRSASFYALLSIVAMSMLTPVGLGLLIVSSSLDAVPGPAHLARWFLIVGWALAALAGVTAMLWARKHSTSRFFRFGWLNRQTAGLILAGILAGNGIGVLVVSSRLHGSADWWSGLWLEVGAGLIFAAVVDLAVEANRAFDGPQDNAVPSPIRVTQVAPPEPQAVYVFEVESGLER